MGQAIIVEETTVLGDVVIFATDRSITGQDGSRYASAAEARDGDTFPARLAGRLFEADVAIDHIFVASNQVVVRRRGGWVQAVADRAARVIEEFFLFYDGEAQGGGG